MLRGLIASIPHSKFRSVKEGMEEAGIQYGDDNQYSIIVWYDTLKDLDYFQYLNPWQVVNRIPSIYVLCRKVPFAYLLARIRVYFPQEFSFAPKTFILPEQIESLKTAFTKSHSTFIIKPDAGSFGLGIYFLKPGENFSVRPEPAIAQEYINSYTVDNRKFDLRLYALIASVIPLSIYLYHDGLGRFCSEDVNIDSNCARITNVTMNRANPEMEISQISQLLSELFPRMKAEGIDIKSLWKRIEDAIGLTIISAYPYLKASTLFHCPSINNSYSRCFQILGFDILLDKNLQPHVLEVNCRPSFDYYRGIERRMKVKMIQQALQIAVPFSKAPEVLMSHKYGWTDKSWEMFIFDHPEIIKDFEKKREKALQLSNYSRIWPSDDPSRKIWKKIIKKLLDIPLYPIPGFRIPSGLTLKHYLPENFFHEFNTDIENEINN